ncbi:hypothetical protein lerEdw1_010969 [Lerista edwardsae]|nr:hypothetical protein lerEdw1_010969 [Lerista edwardsae]
MQDQEAAQEASGRPGSPLSGVSLCLGRRVHFQLPHTTISLPSAQQEEQAFYQRLERLLVGAAGARGSFEELFAAGGWEDLTEDRSLRKRLVRSGQGESSQPRPGQEVTVELLGVLEDRSLVEKDPGLSFVLGQGGAIQALEHGVRSMQLGEVALLLARPSCAYGCLGREPDIPQEAALLYEVTLLQVRDGPDPACLPAAQRLVLGTQKREWGNFHFERREYQQALGLYQLALHIAALPDADPLGPEEEEALREHRVKCLNNSAAAQLKLQQPEEALACCNEALRLDPDNVKALHRKGRLLSEQGEDQAALDVLKRALQLEPTTKAIHVELSKLTRRQKGKLDHPSPGETLPGGFLVATAAPSSQRDGPAPLQPS